MSLFIAGAIAGASLLAALLVGLSEKLRSLARQRRSVLATPLSGRNRRDSASATTPPPHAKRPAASPVSAESRAAVYQEILDALGDDLDQDIAEWEAVLHEFPQVIGSAELLDTDDRFAEPVVGIASEAASTAESPMLEPISSQHRTRRICAEEQGMIHRLLRSGFAPEEIALWLNLPLERVQELLFRDGLT